MRCAICNSNNVDLFKDNIHGYCNVCEKKVDLIFDEHGKSEVEPQKLKVFFSYGHDKHADFVKTLAERIRTKTDGRIDVWIDHIKIRVNDNWREEITDGILKSDEVIAFLSKYSTRERGVCLDELAIAIVSKHGMIKSVLLESADSFSPPALASEYMWADMSDYYKFSDIGGVDWEKYIDEQADKIINMLDSKEIRSYNAELTYLRQKLFLPEIPNELPKFDKLIAKEIVGRKWLEDKIQAWLDDPDGKRIMVLYGKPGAGKSMFAAHLQHYNPQVAAALACDYQSDEYSNTDRIIMWLSYKLALRIPEYRRRLLLQFEDDKFNMSSGKDRFNNLILAPLRSSIDGEHAPMIILIDAMDETKSDDLMRFITDYVDVFTPWIRFLITSRREQEIEECFATYPCIDLEDYADNNEEDLFAYYKSRLDRALSSRDTEEIDNFYKRLVDESEGVFAYAECVCNDILEDIDNNPDMKLESYPLPHGLYELFLYTLRRRKFVWFNENGVELNFQGFWQKPLGMIIASPDPLPIDTLKTLMRWGDNEFQAFREPLTSLLTEVDKHITVFHKSFSEWLNSVSAGKYKTSIEDGFLNLVKGLFKIYKENDVNNTLNLYMLSNMTKFLRRAGLVKEYDEVKNDKCYIDELLNFSKRLSLEGQYEYSINIRMEILKLLEGLEDDAHLYILSEVEQGIGKNYEALRNYYKALLHYKKAIDLSERISRYHPFRIYSMLYSGNILVEMMNDIKGAKIMYDNAIEIVESLDIDSLEFGHLLVVLLNNLAHINCLENDFTSSSQNYEYCLGIAEKLVKKHPYDDEFKIMWAKTLQNFASVDEHLNNTDKAIEKCRKAFEIINQLVIDNPQITKYKINLFCSLMYLGEQLRKIAKYEALAKFEESYALMKKLLVDDSQCSDYRNYLASSLEDMGGIYVKIHEYDVAIDKYKESLMIRENLYNEYPQCTEYTKGLAYLLLHMGFVYRQIGDSCVIAIMERSYNILIRLINDFPQNSDYKYKLSILYAEKYAMYMELNEYKKAFEDQKNSIDLLQQLVKEYPQNRIYKHRLVLFLYNWQDNVDINDTKSYSNILRIITDTFYDELKNEKGWYELAISLYNNTDDYIRLNDLDQAIEDCSLVYVIVKALVDFNSDNSDYTTLLSSVHEKLKIIIEKCDKYHK